ncbi:uncharacterized protein LOC123552673 [Mercenaria mercenaria]|uniref:uncharacterized protein LOC123552673 n=1 Tax=Mercenaria mercenaria TaxID=6596 RepID=UPI00234F521E|nr:uncharacterized protein LOC123552673 [Mercenaria mercenaria]
MRDSHCEFNYRAERCTIIDCGKPHDIEYGSVTLLKASSTMYNSMARVTCQDGYNTRKQVITCKETGDWESSSCDPEDDDRLTLFVLVSILSTLLIVVMILFGFYVIWRYRKRQRKRGSSKEVNTYEEVFRQSQQPQYSDIALENTRVDE